MKIANLSAHDANERLLELHDKGFRDAANKLCLEGRFPRGAIHYSKCVFVEDGRAIVAVQYGGTVSGLMATGIKHAEIEVESTSDGFDYEEAVMKLLLLM